MENEKVIQRRKTLKPFTKKYDNPKVGRKPNAEKELTEEQKEFAIMVARGIPPEIAGAEKGWTPYKIQTYHLLPNMKKEIEKWQDIFGVEQKAKYAKLGDQIVTEAMLSLIRRLKEDKLTEPSTIKLASWAMKQGLGITTDSPQEESIRETTRELKRTYRPSELKSAFDHPDFQDEQGTRLLTEGPKKEE